MKTTIKPVLTGIVAIFSVKLEPGETTLQTHLLDHSGSSICGAMYVNLTRMVWNCRK